MTPQIKQRIEQIRRGEVPDGYKKTKGGIVPSAWASFSLGDIYAERKEVGIPSLPILTVSIHSGVSDGALDEDELGKKVKRIEDKTQYRTARSGDVVFNMMRAWQGAIGVVRQDGLVSPAYVVATPNEAVYPPFMDYCLKTPRMINCLHRKSYGVTDFRLRLYWDSFASVGCALPPLDEQEKIAEIISAQDKLIALKEKLIEEKKRQKKALMQQLLTGKKRLPGFENVWQGKKVSDFATLCTDSIDTCKYSQEKFEVYSLPSYDNKKTPEYLQGSEMNSNKFLVAEGMVLFNKLNVRQKRVWYIDRTSNTRMLSSTEFLPMIVKGINPKFLAQYLLTDSATQYFRLRSSGTSNSQQRIQPNDLMKHSFLVPAVDEQNKIVYVLETFDDEMVLLEKELDQEKQKKKALMQLLLTGIVRV